MSILNMPVIIQSDEMGGYVVECPLLEGCYSQGETIDDALTNIREAIELCLDDLEERGESIPDTSKILTSTVPIIK